MVTEKGNETLKIKCILHQSKKKLKEIRKESKLIVNLSFETLTEYERSLLKKGFKFCPATTSYKKVNFVKDITSWFRNLGIREYFSTKARVRTEQNSVKKDNERSSLNWYIKKEGYPSNDNETLEDYITNVTNDIETMLSDFKDDEWNNLNQNERQSLEKFGSKKSIVIKIADKGGAIVVMNRADNVDKIKKDLNNRKYYKKLDYSNIDNVINEKQLLINQRKDCLDETEYDTLMEDSDTCTPAFHGLPKIHKEYGNFPPLRL